MRPVTDTNGLPDWFHAAVDWRRRTPGDVPPGRDGTFATSRSCRVLMAQCPVPDHQAKDRPADEFDRLLRPLIPLLYRQAFRWTAARDQAEDLVQDLLVKIYPRLDELAALDHVQPWALRVMYRIFVDQHRRATHSPVRPAHELPAHGQGELENPWEHCPRRITAAARAAGARAARPAPYCRVAHAGRRSPRRHRDARHRGLSPRGARRDARDAGRDAQVAAPQGAGTTARAPRRGTFC
jgi:hypothetical protein